MSSSTSELADKQLQLRPLHIIWDWEKCPIPYSTSAKGLYDKAISFFREKEFEVSGFEGFGDSNQMNHSKYNALKEEGKIVLHHNDRSEARIAARIASLQFLCDRLTPCPILIITDNRDFVGIFEALKEREFDVYLAYNNDTTKGLFMSQATEAWHYLDVFGIDMDKCGSKPKIGGKKRKAIRLRRERKEAAKAAKGETSGGANANANTNTNTGMKKRKIDKSSEKEAATTKGVSRGKGKGLWEKISCFNI